MSEQARNLAVERFGLGEIHQANGAPADLVFIGGADAALGGADLHAAEVRRFPKRVEFPMQRQNQRDVFGDLEVIWRHFHAKSANFVDFIDKMVRIEHDAVADHRQLARPHDARRQKRELVGLAVDHQGVTGVMAALETHHHVGGHRQPVDDLALTLVAPLGADNHNVRHRRTIPRVPKGKSPGASDNGLDRGSLRAWTTRLQPLSKAARRNRPPVAATWNPLRRPHIVAAGRQARRRRCP